MAATTASSAARKDASAIDLDLASLDAKELLDLLADDKRSAIEEFKDARVGSLKELWEALGQYTHGAFEGRTEEDWEAFKLLYGETVKSLDLPEPPSMVASGSCNTPAIPKIVVPIDSSSSLTPLPSGGQSSSSQPSGNQQPSALPTSIVLPPASPPHSPSHPDIPLDMTTLSEGSTFFPPSPPPDDIFPSRDAQHLLLPLVTPFARSLYPLPPLPADARRPVLKGASSKAGSVSSKKGRVQAPVQEGVDLTRWFAQVQANPVSKLMGTARKCLGSDDWATAHQELRFLRAMGRIEELKLEGRWSFRQPKKQKGPPVGKSSWDWLLEEMKWLQTDFREERRWKIACAWELSQAVMQFHAAVDKRVVCVRVGGKWAVPSVDGRAGGEEEEQVDVEMRETAEVEDDEAEDDGVQEEDVGVAARLKRRRRGDPPEEEEVSQPPPSKEATVEPEGEEEEEAEEDKTSDDVMAVDADSAPADKKPKEEAKTSNEAEDEMAVDEVVDSAKVSTPAPDKASPAPPTDTKARPAPLKHDDLPTPPPESLPPSDQPPPAFAAAAARHHKLRSSLATLAPSSLTLDFSPFFDTPFATEASSSSSEHDDNPLAAPPPELSALALTELFGDITPYVPATPLSPSHHAAGKIDRRIDDATASGGKLAHTSRLMDIRPVLVSTLNPGRKRKNDRWDDLSDLWGGGDELRDLGEMKGEVYSSGTPLFAGKKVRDSAHLPILIKPPLPRNFETRLASTIWQPEDDIVLQRLCLQFPFNWQLISDAFNTARRTLSIDRRSPWDCYQRWNKKWNPNKEADLPPDVETEGTTSPGGTITKKMAKIMPALLDAKYEGSKKKLRHAKLYEAMRKTAKRRDITNRKPNLKGEPRRVLTAHESHHAFVSSRPGTPQELSQAKFERDRAYHERELHEQQARQQAMYRAMQARTGGQQSQHLPNVSRPAPAGQPAPHPQAVPNTSASHMAASGLGQGGGGPASQQPANRPAPTPQQQAAHLAALAQRAAAAASASGGRLTANQLSQMQALQAAQRAAQAAANANQGGGAPVQQRTGTPAQQLQQKVAQGQGPPPAHSQGVSNPGIAPPATRPASTGPPAPSK